VFAQLKETDMSTTVSPSIVPFANAERYEQPEPGEAEFAWLLKKDSIPGLQSGLVKLKGPIHKTPAVHEAFHQVYVIYAGSGTIHLGSHSQRVSGPTLAVIPKGTLHSVELRAGETIEYVFVNQYR
jgi:mannose-6-phosphate isomerase-like protein (cupin superfamily)